jgi:hypothetical protein
MWNIMSSEARCGNWTFLDFEKSSFHSTSFSRQMRISFFHDQNVEKLIQQDIISSG